MYKIKKGMPTRKVEEEAFSLMGDYAGLFFGGREDNGSKGPLLEFTDLFSFCEGFPIQRSLEEEDSEDSHCCNQANSCQAKCEKVWYPCISTRKVVITTTTMHDTVGSWAAESFAPFWTAL